jgi:hypothetical protein
MKRFAALCLALIMLFALLPAAVFAADNSIRISSCAFSGGDLAVSGTAAGGTGVFVASYNEDGKQLAVRQTTADSASGKWSASLSASGGAVKVKAFLVEGNTYAPLASDSMAVCPYTVTASAEEVPTGESVTLTVSGFSGSHTCQWYSTPSLNVDPTPIGSAAGSSYTFSAAKTALYSCSVDGIMTQPVKITVLNCVSSVTGAHLALDSGNQLCVQFTKPEHSQGISSYYAVVKYGTSEDSSYSTGETSIPILDFLSSLKTGQTYTVSVISRSTMWGVDDSRPAACSQSFTAVQTTEAAPSVTASQPVHNNSDYTYSLTFRKPGCYCVRFYTNSTDSEPCKTAFITVGSDSLTQDISSGQCAACKVETVSAASKSDGNFVINCSQAASITFQTPLTVQMTQTDYEVSPNESVLLSVTVGDTKTHTYQWYCCSDSAATLLTGKTAASCKVDTSAPGTLLYYCMVDGSIRSDTAFVRVGTEIAGITAPVLSVSDAGEPMLSYTEAPAESTDLIDEKSVFLHNTEDTSNWGDNYSWLGTNPASLLELLGIMQDGMYTLRLATEPVDTTTYRNSYADYSGKIIVRTDSAKVTPAVFVDVQYNSSIQPSYYRYKFTGEDGYYCVTYVTDAGTTRRQILTLSASSEGTIFSGEQWSSCEIQKVEFAMTGTDSKDLTATRYAASKVLISAAVEAKLEISSPAVNPGASVRLTATVTGLASPNYAWYSNTVDRTNGGTLISGASGNPYQPDTTTCGTTYYYYTATVGDKTYTSNVVELVVGTPLPGAVNPQLGLVGGIPGIVFTAPTEPKNLYYYIYAYNETGKHAGQQYVSQPQYAYLPNYLLISGASGTYHAEIASCSRDPQYREATVQCPGTFTIIDSDAETPAPTVHSVAITQGSSTVYDYYVTAAKAGTYTICSDRGSCQMFFFSQDGETKSFTEKYQYSTCTVRLLTTTEDSSGNLTITRSKATSSIPISSVQVSASASAAEANLNTNVTLTANTNLASASYQWYEAKNSDVTTGGTQISGATGQTYAASASSACTKYYYCVINGIYTTDILTVVFGDPLPTAQNCKLGLLGGIPGVIFTAPEDTDHTINYYFITASSTSGQNQASNVSFDPAHAYLHGHTMMSSPAGAYQASVSSVPRSSDTQHRTTTASCPGTITITDSTSVTPALSIVFQTKTTQNSTSYINYVTAPQAGAYVLEVSVSSKYIIYQYLSFTSNGETKSFETPQLITACSARRLIAAASDTSGVTNLTITREASAAAVVGTTPVTASAASDVSGVDVGNSANLTAAVTGLTGTLSYQWYSNTDNSTGGATPITGADSSSYTATPEEAGTMYYYCVINGVYVTNILKLDAGTALPPVENPAITVANGVAKLTFTAPADSAGIGSYAVNVVYPSGYVETRGAISASSPLNLNNFMFYMQPGVYSIQIVSKPAGGSEYRETAVDAGSVTIVSSTDPSPALSISTSKISNDQNNYYSYRCSASPNVGYYQLSYSDGTHNYRSDCALPMENEFAYEGLMESFTVQCSLASETDGAVTITKYASAAAAVVLFSAAASPSAVAPGAEVTLKADTLAGAAYQWYSSTNGNTVGGTAILNATGSSYSYTASDAALESYYYCVATVNGLAYTSNSVTVTVTSGT